MLKPAERIRPGIARVVLTAVVLGTCGALSSGCKSPSTANIQLRKENQALRDELRQLKIAKHGDEATIHALEAKATTVPVLPEDRVAQLFTVHGFRFGRLTGGAQLDADRAWDTGIKVYVSPTDDVGDTIKAAGSFLVEAYDLEDPHHPLVGQWTFPIEDAAKNWYAGALLNTYALSCRWEKPPAHPRLTIHVQFTDELTRRTFTDERVVTVQLAPKPNGTTQVTSGE